MTSYSLILNNDQRTDQNSRKEKKRGRKKKEIFNNKIADSNPKKGPLSVNKGAAGEAWPLYSI
jgi:hypothetical protein